ncbi:ATP-binding protein [Shewanella sp. NIFS-20-20]|uniref:ATP-binding protein n=1 Tax=Shewanella sp. NIFS-20-20 TaxID=2853806 RepID=UPI001C48FEBC|nr:ATP-binding protein [Shewanella sp. NIFS-20-20]MBV7316268.1 ATP-binding protein [Shewanella sp. NIFS-20-20]
MNKYILLLGPSGIGKTTVVKQLHQSVSSVTSVILDNLAHQHARNLGLIDKKDNLNALIAALEHDRERFLSFGLEALEHFYEKQADKLKGNPIIVDIGTGFLDAQSSMAWVTDHPSICLLSEPASAYDRFRKARQLDVSYEQYLSTQFCKHRVAIYNKAGVVLKTDNLDEQLSAQRFICCVLGMLEPANAAIALGEWLNDH